jgi:hypothetical protein
MFQVAEGDLLSFYPGRFGQEKVADVHPKKLRESGEFMVISWDIIGLFLEYGAFDQFLWFVNHLRDTFIVVDYIFTT